VGRYFLTSNPRRFNVKIYPAIGKVDFLRRIDVDSSSKSVCVDMVYFSTSNQRRYYVKKYLCRHGIFLTSIQRWNFPIHKDCRFINVEYTSIPRRCFTHGIRRFFDFECTSIQRWYFPINKPFRFFKVEYSATPRRGFPKIAKGTSSGPWGPRWWPFYLP